MCADKVEEGSEVRIHLVPDEGFFTADLRVYMRGIEPPITREDYDNSIVYNVVGDLTIEADFFPDLKKNLAIAKGEDLQNFKRWDKLMRMHSLV